MKRIAPSREFTLARALPISSNTASVITISTRRSASCRDISTAGEWCASVACARAMTKAESRKTSVFGVAAIAIEVVVEMLGHVRRAVEVHAGGDFQPFVRIGVGGRGFGGAVERLDVMQHLLLLLGRERAQFFHDGFGDAHNFNTKIASNAKYGKRAKCSRALAAVRASSSALAKESSSKFCILIYLPEVCGESFGKMSNRPAN